MAAWLRGPVLAVAVALVSCASAEPPPGRKPVVASAPLQPPECDPGLCTAPGYACQRGRCLAVCNPPCRPDAQCARPNFCDEDTVDEDLDNAVRQRRHDGPDTF